MQDTRVLLSSDSEVESEASLSEGLVKWINKHDVKRTATDDLLKLLNSHGLASLPSSARTLLKTDKVVMSEDKSGMKYIYLGIENSIIKSFDKYQLKSNKRPTGCQLHLTLMVFLSGTSSSNDNRLIPTRSKKQWHKHQTASAVFCRKLYCTLPRRDTISTLETMTDNCVYKTGLSKPVLSCVN